MRCAVGSVIFALLALVHMAQGDDTLFAIYLFGSWVMIGIGAIVRAIRERR